MIIGIGHRSEQGKDTVANFMIQWSAIHQPSVKIMKVSWAKKLKDICHQLYWHLGLKEGDFYETEEGRALRNIRLPKINKTPVEIWIDMGTPAVRNQVWDRTWIEYVKNIPANIIIAPDTRFMNEIEACDVTIKVANPRIPKREGKSVDDVLKDYNEWNHYIINNKGKEELKKVTDILCEKLFN
jgi:hypothetical protein